MKQPEFLFAKLAAIVRYAASEFHLFPCRDQGTALDKLPPGK